MLELELITSMIIVGITLGFPIYVMIDLRRDNQ